MAATAADFQLTGRESGGAATAGRRPDHASLGPPARVRPANRREASRTLLPEARRSRPRQCGTGGDPGRPGRSLPGAGRGPQNRASRAMIPQNVSVVPAQPQASVMRAAPGLSLAWLGRREGGHVQQNSPHGGWLRAAWRPAWLVAALFVVAVGVFAVGVWRPAFWVDEYLTQSAIARPWPDLMQWIVSKDPGPGPYYLAMKIWSAVSTTPGWMRLPSVFAAAGSRCGVRRARPAADRPEDRRPRGGGAAGPAERVPLRAGAPSVRLRLAVHRARR